MSEEDFNKDAEVYENDNVDADVDVNVDVDVPEGHAHYQPKKESGALSITSSCPSVLI